MSPKLSEDQHTSARIVADVDVELLTISRADLVKLLENTPELAAKIYYSICKTLSERLRRADTYILLLQ
jgi:CRP-like cAMP-binding protein